MGRHTHTHTYTHTYTHTHTHRDSCGIIVVRQFARLVSPETRGHGDPLLGVSVKGVRECDRVREVREDEEGEQGEGG